MTDGLAKRAIMPATHTKPPAKFSHGVRKGNILQVAGQVGYGIAIPGEAPQPVGHGLRDQSLQTLANVEAVLREGGASWEDVVMIRVYLTDAAYISDFNEVYDWYFAGLSGVPAARTTVYVGLPPGLLVEIDALAVLG